MKKKFIAVLVIGVLFAAGGIFFVCAKVAASFQESTTNKNAKFADEDWWRTATPEDVRKEIKKGASVKKIVVLHDTLCGASCPVMYVSLRPLSLAIQYNGNPQIIKELIEAGADVNARDSSLIPPLMGAVYANDFEIIKILIIAGADVNAQDGQGRTALTWARLERKWEIVKMLIEAGA